MKKFTLLLFACSVIFSFVIISSCQKSISAGPDPDPGGPEDTVAAPTKDTAYGDVVYLETNDPTNNAILAYFQKGDSLHALPGSPFSTGGAGIANPTQALGPNDADNQLLITSDKKFLLAVNPGSNNISVFSIKDHGQLEPVVGSPFDSYGQTPVSIGQNDNFIFVVNKALDSSDAQKPFPNYTVFTLDGAGSLKHVSNSSKSSAKGSSPTQVLISKDKHYMFGTDFLGSTLNPAVGTLRSFGIDTGKLIGAEGTPYIIPEQGGALGLWEHPSGNVLYAGFPQAGKVGVYTLEPSTGVLTFNNSVSAGLSVSRLRTDNEGKFLYALNSGENTVSVYNSANPTSLTSVQKFTLKNSGPTYSAMGSTFTTSEGFSLSLSTSGKLLYVISQYTNPDFGLGNYNLLHVLKVDTDGKLSEPTEPLPLPVTANVRPQGVVTIVYNP